MRGNDAGLVVRRPVADPVAQPADDCLRVFDKGLRGRTNRPAPGVLERLRRIPVEQRRERLDAGCEQLVDQEVVEVESCRIERPASLREDTGPGDGEAEGVESELPHEGDVLGPAVVEVAGDLSGIAAANVAGCHGEAIPDTLAPSV